MSEALSSYVRSRLETLSEAPKAFDGFANSVETDDPSW